MDDQGEEAAEYLFNRFGLSRNSLLTIDLNDRGLDDSEFPRFCTALSLIYCEKLRCDVNPWVSTQNYRFMLIHFGKHLLELDGKKVQMDERANAQRAVNAMKLDKKAFMMEKGAEGMLIQLRNAGGGAGAAALAPNASDAANNAETVHSAPIGSLLSKWEIVINFLQVWTSLFTLTVNWPDWWWNLNIRWTYVVNIDVSLGWLQFLSSYQYTLKFVILVLLPVLILVIYSVSPLVSLLVDCSCRFFLCCICFLLPLWI
jgi:hypothetical protein